MKVPLDPMLTKDKQQIESTEMGSKSNDLENGPKIKYIFDSVYDPDPEVPKKTQGTKSNDLEKGSKNSDFLE